MRSDCRWYSTFFRWLHCWKTYALLSSCVGCWLRRNRLVSPPKSQNQTVRYSGGQKCMSFSTVQPSKKKKTLRCEIDHTKHRSPPPVPLWTFYIVSLHAQVKSLLELAISSCKNGSQARIVGPKVHHLSEINKWRNQMANKGYPSHLPSHFHFHSHLDAHRVYRYSISS